MSARKRKSKPRWHTLVEDNGALVQHVLEHTSIPTGCRLSREQLLAAGRDGLVRGAKSFEPKRGHAFSTYAVPKIRGAIRDAVRDDDGNTRTQRDRIVATEAMRERLRHELLREPTRAEVAKALRITTREAEAAMALTDTKHVASLDHPSAASNGGGVLRDAIPSPPGSVPDPEEETHRKMVRDKVLRWIQSLPEDERKVVRLRFGTGRGKEHGINDTADALGMSVARVKRLEASAMTRMRGKVAGSSAEAWLPSP